MWRGYYSGDRWPMFVGSFLFWKCMIAPVAWVIHRLTGRSPYHGKSPLHHLKERYTPGEIMKQELEEMTRDLRA